PLAPLLLAALAPAPALTREPAPEVPLEAPAAAEPAPSDTLAAPITSPQPAPSDTLAAAPITSPQPAPSDTLARSRPSPASAADLEAPPPWQVGAFVDVLYAFNSNLPDNHLFRGHYTAPRTGEPIPNLAGAWILHEPAPGRPYRFELALHVGPAADALVAGEPTPGGAESRYAGPETWKNLSRANAGVRLGRGTDLDAGVFVCPIGFGTFWTRDNWNYTTAWQLNSVPYYLSGGRLTQQLPAGFALQAWVVSGWQTLADVNSVPSYLAGLTWTRGTINAQSLLFAGPESQDIALRAWRVFSNTQVLWDGERVGLGALVDVGRERLTALPGAPVAFWMDLQALARVRPLRAVPGWTLTLRGDAFWDRDAFIFGTRGWLAEGTFTSTLRLWDHIQVRLEYRYDHATDPAGFFFRGAAQSPGAPGLARDQHTALLALAGWFETRVGKRRR
ncbi:MAG TPA: outer membrane beta-barrel protein, partial [Nannocystaceae bacterium]|nr:outer membrane beta-barrel protein [Nannocystaceae bacterium]